MNPTIPFDVWYQDVETLLDIIKKCNFDVIDLVGSYGYKETNITLVKEGLYSFKNTRNAFHYNKPNPNPPPPPQQAAVGKTVTTITGIYQQASSQYPATVLSSDQIQYYEVEILCNKERILKIAVSEKWLSNHSSLSILDNDGMRKVHTVIFHDMHVLANGEWFEYDSPDAFIKDVGDSDISILCMIDVYERFKNER